MNLDTVRQVLRSLAAQIENATTVVEAAERVRAAADDLSGVPGPTWVLWIERQEKVIRVTCHPDINKLKDYAESLEGTTLSWESSHDNMSYAYSPRDEELSYSLYPARVLPS